MKGVVPKETVVRSHHTLNTNRQRLDSRLNIVLGLIRPKMLSPNLSLNLNSNLNLNELGAITF